MIQYKTKQITVFESALYETTTTVIESNEAIVLVDPNWLPEEISKIRAHIDQRIKNKQLYLVITHSDYDHIIGSGAFPEAIVIASESFKLNKDKQARLDEITVFDQMYYLTRVYEVSYPKVNIVIKENETHISLGDLACIFYLSPGHTDDGLFFYIKQLNILIVGDYLSNVEFPFITSSYNDYVKTINLMKEVTKKYHVALLIPGHGKVTTHYDERLDFSIWYLQMLSKQNNIETELKEKFIFYEGMKQAHQDNLRLAKGRDYLDD